MADKYQTTIQRDTARLIERIEQLEKDLKGFAKMTVTKLKRQIITMNIGQRVRLYTKEDPKLIKRLRGNVGKRQGDIDRISFRITQGGIFTEMGAGKGRKAGSSKANALAKKWLSPVLDQETEALADFLVEQYADIIVAEIAINIPGVIQTKI